MSAQKQLLFRVPNTPDGRAFIEWTKTFLNTDSYRLNVRGSDGESIANTKTLKVYLVAKTSNGYKTIGITDANRMNDKAGFMHSAREMQNLLSNMFTNR